MAWDVHSDTCTFDNGSVGAKNDRPCTVLSSEKCNTDACTQITDTRTSQICPQMRVIRFLWTTLVRTLTVSDLLTSSAYSVNQYYIWLWLCAKWCNLWISVRISQTARHEKALHFRQTVLYGTLKLISDHATFWATNFSVKRTIAHFQRKLVNAKFALKTLMNFFF